MKIGCLAEEVAVRVDAALKTAAVDRQALPPLFCENELVGQREPAGNKDMQFQEEVLKGNKASREWAN
eukprot:5987574-Prorocentrum_lima.AAC.1